MPARRLSERNTCTSVPAMTARSLVAGMAAVLVAVGSASSGATQTALDGPPLYTAGVAGPTEQADVERWVDAAYGTLRSARFRSNLASLGQKFPTIYFRDGGPRALTGSVTDLQAILDGTGSHRYVRIALAVYGDNSTDNASTVWNGEFVERGSQYGSMTIGRRHLVRWREKDNLVEQSCAINTLTHEISHIISIEPERYIIALADTNTRFLPPDVPVASYLIGSVAQCTWLQTKGRVLQDGLEACVAVFGTRHFNSLRCDQFDSEEPVIERRVFPAPVPD